MALTQGGMTQEPGLEAWESFSEVSEEEADASFSLAGGETGKGALGLDVLGCQPSQEISQGEAATLLLLGSKRLWEAPIPGLPSTSSWSHLLLNGLSPLLSPVPLLHNTQTRTLLIISVSFLFSPELGTCQQLPAMRILPLLCAFLLLMLQGAAGKKCVGGCGGLVLDSIL